ncbi:MAG TPA: metal ABC transporter substrate-binding protein [Acidimicrobiia bacterium]
MKLPHRAFLVMLCLIAVGCAPTSNPGSQGPLVVATTTILGDMVAAIVGDQATVETLMPPGADPHDFQPSSQQVALINGADLVIANGLGLEEGFIDVLDAAKADGVNLLEVGPLIDPIPFAEGGSEELGEDPHFWNDPVRAATGAAVIADALSDVDPSVDWSSRATEYGNELRDLASEIEVMLQGIPAADRKLVTNHDSLGYFADRYGFEILGVVIPGGSTLAEPSSAELANLVQVMREQSVSVIFAETTSPSVLADAVADEIGEPVLVVELYTDSLGPPGSGAETLLDMLRLDAELIASALS